MPKSLHSPEFRAMASQEYIEGMGSHYYLSDKYQIGRTTIQKWMTLFRVYGIEVFITSAGNKSYTKEFKMYCVEAVTTREYSLTSLF